MGTVSISVDSATVDSSQRMAWFTLWVLVITALFSFVDRQVLALLTEQVSRTLSLRDTQIGIIQGLGSATFAVFATYPLGWLTDHFDRRIVLGGCIVTWSAGTAACGLAQGFWSLFAAVVAISAAEAGLPALAYSAIPDLFSGDRRLAANQMFYVALILSSAMGIAFGGAADYALKALAGNLPAALSNFESWRIIFFLVALPAPLLVLLVAISRLGVRPKMSRSSLIDGSTDFGPYIRENGATATLVISALSFYGLPFLAVLTWTPAALTRLFAVTPSRNGLGIGLGLGVGCILGVALASWLMRALRPKLGCRAPLRISFVVLLISAPVGIFYAFVQNEWQAFAVVGLLMLSGTLIGSLLPGILQSLAPPALTGRIVALYGVLSVITSGLGVSIVGPFSDRFPHDPRALLIGVAGLLTISWLIGAILMRLSETSFERLVTAFGEPDS